MSDSTSNVLEAMADVTCAFSMSFEGVPPELSKLAKTFCDKLYLQASNLRGELDDYLDKTAQKKVIADYGRKDTNYGKF